MQSEEVHMELRALHSHGWSINRLAREFGLNWRTVKREVESLEARRYEGRHKPTALTEAQQAHIERRLIVCPTIRGTILHHELRRDYGYVGSYPAFIRHLRPLRPAVSAEPVVRFETDPGIQVQTDWAHFGVWPVEEEEVQLYGLVSILGFSRTPAIRCSVEYSRLATFERLIWSLHDLGGVPREVLTDRDGIFCSGSRSDGGPILAPAWVDFCGVLGVVPRACRPYRAKTKGKVERMVREAKESFLAWLSGVVVPSHPTLGDYDLLAQQWRAEVVLPRKHRTTSRVIGEAWEEERHLLRPLPSRLLHDPVAVARAPGVIDLQLRRLGETVEVRDLAEYEVVL